jgi:hypothetical protein
MSSPGQYSELLVQVMPLADSDAEEVADLTALLREDLLDLDVAAVEPLPEENIPEGSKGLGVVAGWLAVKLSPAALKLVVDRVSAWARRNNTSVEIHLGNDVLKMTGVSQDAQKQLIDGWLARQATSS